jgi:hypothetical protein
MPYSEEDAPFFFGREGEREIITANLLASRLTLLYGASGVGKSSVLRAGVAYHLHQVAQQNLAERGTPEFAVVVFSSWSEDPLAGLADCVRDSVAQTVGATHLGSASHLESRALAQTLQAWAERVGGDLLIILDQFEEYFLYHPQEDGEGAFAVEFPSAVNRPDLRVSFLISIREDSLAKLDRFKGRIPNLFDNYLRIEHLDREAARAAIEKPVEQYSQMVGQRFSVEPALVEAVLEQVRTGQVVLGEAGRGMVGAGPAPTQIETPYLQLVMTRLWEKEMGAGSRTLRLETLNRLGGAEQIVKRHLDAALSGLPPREQEATARVFHHLVTPSGTKIAHTVPDLAEYAELAETQVAPVLDKLSGAEIRILRPVPGGRYEIFHDVLAPAILDWRARFVQAARERERIVRERRKRQRQLQLTLAAVGAAVVFLFLALLAWGQRNQALQAQAEAVAAQATAEAEADARAAEVVIRSTAEAEAVVQRDAAEKAKAEALAQQEIALVRQLAAQAELMRDQQAALLPRSVLLAVESLHRSPTLEGDQALRHGLALLPRPVARMEHEGGVRAVAFSPDGQWLATRSGDGTARVWEAASGQEVARMAHEAEVWAVAFSPDGQWLATGSYDGTARVWEAASGQEAARMAHKAPVLAVAFSPDGQWLATGSLDNTARVWEAASGQEVARMAHEDRVVAVAFSPDGQWLATGSLDNTARVWEAQPAGRKWPAWPTRLGCGPWSSAPMGSGWPQEA